MTSEMNRTFETLWQSSNSAARCGVLRLQPGQQTLQYLQEVFQYRKKLSPSSEVFEQFIKSNFTISTPAVITTTSRGVVPHLTLDNLKHVQSDAFYVGLEDFMEKTPVDIPLVKFPGLFRSQLPLETEKPLFLGPRRSRPIPISANASNTTKSSNTNNSLLIMTCEGFRQAPISHYLSLAEKFSPEVMAIPADLPSLRPDGRPDTKPGGNRVRRMLARNAQWLSQTAREVTEAQSESGLAHTTLLASVLPGVPVTPYGQLSHLQQIAELGGSRAVGLLFWDTETPWQGIKEQLESDVCNKELPAGFEVSGTEIRDRLASCVRMLGPACTTPQEILRAVKDGFDLMTNDVVGLFTDRGLALNVEFPVGRGEKAEEQRDVAVDLWDSKYKTDMRLLNDMGTKLLRHDNERFVYTRAYVHHLLDAHEMTAWVILYMVNTRVIEDFMDGVLASLERGTFEEDYDRFIAVYGSHEAVAEFLRVRDTKGVKGKGYQVGYDKLDEIRSGPTPAIEAKSRE